eukprot:366811-Prymnesium_polylepis.1
MGARATREGQGPSATFQPPTIKLLRAVCVGVCARVCAWGGRQGRAGSGWAGSGWAYARRGSGGRSEASCRCRGSIGRRRP